MASEATFSTIISKCDSHNRPPEGSVDTSLMKPIFETFYGATFVGF